MYTPDNMTDESHRRLESLSEFSELGSGFRLALRDLEIRGAGALLSPKQHGFVKDVGFELYGRLIEEALGERPAVPSAAAAAPPALTIDLRVSAHLPEEYVPADEVRIGYYRRLADVTEFAQADAIAEELRDRFGKLPSSALALLDIARLRVRARAAGVAGIVEDDEGLTISFDPARLPGPDAVLALGKAYGERISFARGGQPVIHLSTDEANTDTPSLAADFLTRLADPIVPARKPV
jgi:transcription-repair coupling factor (superfamily II helicase)